MKIRRILLGSALLMTLSGFAQMKKVDFVEYDLPNGLHVILHKDNSTPIVAVTVLYHVGSKNEQPNRTGMAHFFEHLLFEGSENIKRGEFDKYIENAGGILNANTSNDRTFYYELLPSNQLELGLWLESERMMHAKVEKIGIETQREVVKEERRQRTDNVPYGSLIEETFKRAFKVHPYRWPVIGSMEHLNAASEQEFMDFYKTFYVPNNATLSIAGDIDIEATKALIGKYFTDIPKGSKAIPRPGAEVAEPQQTAELRDTVLDNIQLPLVLQAYHIPAQGTPDYYAVEMLSSLISGGESSRFNKKLVDEKQLAINAGLFAFGGEDPGLCLAYCITNANVKPEEAEKEMDSELNRVKNELISDEELQKLKNQIEARFVSNAASVAGIAEELANYHTYFGDANLINTEIDRFLKVTKEDIQRVAKKYFNKENRVVLYYLPKSAGK
ncbi:MAG TPA: pitrilysin family protein [Luteibaculaceae bacterium]|nr:pitrilysin family protein [Luteibaculaceae bacterium]